MAEVRTTTRRVLDAWGGHYEGNGVPVELIKQAHSESASCAPAL